MDISVIGGLDDGLSESEWEYHAAQLRNLCATPGGTAEVGVGLLSSWAATSSWQGLWSAIQIYEQEVADSIATLAVVKQLAQLPSWERYLADRGATLASSIVAAKTGVDLTPILKGLAASPRTLQLAMLVLHEAIALGRVTAAVQDIGAECHAITPAHPLAALPLCQCDFETAICAPRRERLGVFYQPACRLGLETPTWERQSLSPSAVIEVQDLSFDSAMVSAVEQWRSASNGRVEVSRARLDRPLEEGGLATTISSIEMKWLRTGDVRSLTGQRISPATAYSLLFHAAAGGCAHWKGSFGAIGRLKAWTSLTSIAQCISRSVDDVCAQVNATEWFYFECPSSEFFLDRTGGYCFYVVPLAAVSPNRENVTVFAASDFP